MRCSVKCSIRFTTLSILLDLRMLRAQESLEVLDGMLY